MLACLFALLHANAHQHTGGAAASSGGTRHPHHEQAATASAGHEANSLLSGTSGKRRHPSRTLVFDGALRHQNQWQRSQTDNTLTRAAAKQPSVMPSSYNKSACTKWAALTTIFEPGEAARRVSWLGGGWCFVVALDLKSPEEAWHQAMADGSVRRDTTVLLDVATQRRMASASPFVAALPWNHFARKNVAFLFAVAAGATSVFDFDDDNIISSKATQSPLLNIVDPPPSAPTPSAANGNGTAAAAAARLVHPHVFAYDRDALAHSLGPVGYNRISKPSAGSGLGINPYVAMGATNPLIWPRGLPLNDSTADGDPDVDAVYRLTSAPDVATGVRFVGNATALLPQGVFAPTNAQATLHTRYALWGALLPSSVHGRVSDIWRGYMSQRLFWDVGLGLAFAPGGVTQERTPHDLAADLQAEGPLYTRAEELLWMLRSWRCDDGSAPSPSGNVTRHSGQHVAPWKLPPPLKTLPACMEQLWVDMYEHGFVQRSDVLLAQMWIDELKAASYAFPPVLKPKPRYALELTRSRIAGPVLIGSGEDSGKQCMPEPEVVVKYWRTLQRYPQSERLALTCEGKTVTMAGGGDKIGFCSTCSRQPEGFWPGAAIGERAPRSSSSSLPSNVGGAAAASASHPRAGRPPRRVLVHLLARSALGNLMMCMATMSAYAAWSDRQYVVAIDPSVAKSEVSEVYAQLMISTYTRLQGIDVTNASWWREARAGAIDKWGAIEKVPWVIDPNRRQTGLEMLSSTHHPLMAVADCTRAWLKQDIAWHDADAKGRDGMISGPLSRPYCYASLPSTIDQLVEVGSLPRGLPQRFGTCALAHLFGEAAATSEADRLARTVIPRRPPAAASAAAAASSSNVLNVVIHVRVGNSVWSPTHYDVRTHMAPSMVDWRGFFTCAKTMAQSFVRRSGRARDPSLRWRWYVATDWPGCLGNASLVFGSKDAGSTSEFIEPLPGRVVLSGDNPYGSRNTTREEHTADTNKVLAEHLIMANADFLLAAPSSFSMTAAMISLLPGETVPQYNLPGARGGASCEMKHGAG